MVKRNLAPVLIESLADTPVVFLQGPRQSGKSTLAKALSAEGYEAEYLTFDDATILSAARADPQGFISGLRGNAIIDEVQRVPDLFLAIKAAVDGDRRPGRFLLTGSANVLVLPKLAEALVGRVEIHTLWPLSQGEFDGTSEAFVDAMFGPGLPGTASLRADPEEARDRVTRGGYPEAVSRPTAARRQAWYRSYIATMLQREVRDLANIEGLTELPRLLSLLAARTSQLLNYSELARSQALPQTTLKRYWSLLEATFLVQTLPPWSTNIGKRFVKSPKMLLCDTGLACGLQALDAARLETDRELFGRLLENFVAMELRKQLGWSQTQASMFHYRTHAQREVDIVLEDTQGGVVGIEVKASGSVTAKAFAGLHDLAEAARERFVRGIVLYQGQQAVAFGDKMQALPVSSLWHSPTPPP